MTPAAQIIEVRIADLRQLFNAIDPSPFREKDLDPNAEEFIVGWARELPRDAPLELVIHVDRPVRTADSTERVDDAVHQFFANRAQHTRRRLRMLFREGRISLGIGIAFLILFIWIGNVVAEGVDGSRLAGIIRESFVIGGWVAMWRPLEVFLYDWWPIRAEARLYDRLTVMPVTVQYQA